MLQHQNIVSWTSTISSFLRSGHADLALREFFLMSNSGLHPNEFGLSLALKATRLSATKPATGRLIHGFAIKTGYESYDFCSSSLLDMYAKSGNMDEARKLFYSVPRNCEAIWNTLIGGYARSYNDADEAVELFHQMLLSFTSPNSYTYTILIKLLADMGDIGLLRFFHGRTVKAGFARYNFVGVALLDAYGKWGQLDDSVKMFWLLEERDHVVWTALLASFRNNGDLEQGLDLYLKYVSQGYRLDMFMFANVFKLCSELGTTRLGFQVHSCFAKSGFVLDSYIGSALIDMYASFAMVGEAYKGFLETTDKNEVTYSVMIHGFVCQSDYASALELFREMRMLDFLVLDNFTISCVLRAITGLDIFEGGRVLHSWIIRTFGEKNITIGNSLIEMYSKSGMVDEAATVFMAMEVCNEFSCTALISGYIESERYEEAMEFYNKMKSSSSIEPSQFTLVAILQASSKPQELQKGRQTHNYIMKKGFQSDVYIESALIGMYAKCGCIEDASRIFSAMSEWDLVSWSSMIASYSQHRQGEKALKLFSEYKDRLVSIDEFVFSSCLSACSILTALKTGRTIHASTIKTGFESNLQIGSTIVDMYSKCGDIEEAHDFFERMREHNVVSYTVMICGYAQHGLGREALGLFDRMKDAGLRPDSVTLIGVLSACSHLGLVKEGWEYFNSMAKEFGLEKTESHYACIIDLLGRSGQVNKAEQLIADAPFEYKTLLWRTLLGACNLHGNVEDGNRIAEMLIRLEPGEPSNYVTLSNLLASVSMWDHSSELKQKLGRWKLKKTPGLSWIELAC